MHGVLRNFFSLPSTHQQTERGGRLLAARALPASQTIRTGRLNLEGTMAQECVHRGCGKLYTDPDEVCIYHPGPPVFHEGQKGKSLELRRHGHQALHLPTAPREHG